MSTLAGYTRTGRIQLGPGSDLVELQGPGGARYTAIVFHPEYRSHNAINAALGVVLSFLESPMVSGLTDLGAYALTESTFAYPTGQAWSVAEVVRTLSDLGEVGGVRAGVELMAQVGMVLIEAAETGEGAGVYSHGGLTPWRVMLSVEGQAQVIGHALPQVEILTFHEQPDRVPREDAFRYCPPERMESKRENFSSDLFGLALMAFEVMCGKPVYDGLVNDIRAKASRGETSRRIHQFREFLPDSVRVLLTTVLRPDFRDRFGSGNDYFQAVNTALEDPAVQGVGLRDMMLRVSRQQPRARQELDPGKTSMLSKEALQRMMEEEEGPGPGRLSRVAASQPARPLPQPPPRGASAPPPSPPATSFPVSGGPLAALDESALTASPSRVGLPPARRPPPRAPVVEDLPAAALGAGAGSGPALPADLRVSGVGELPRPAIGVARLPPGRRVPGSSDASPLAAPVVAPVVAPIEGVRVVPAPPAFTSGDRARELLAAVGISGDSGPAPRPTPSAAEVIERIMGSSGSTSNSLQERVARAVNESAPPLAPAPVAGPAVAAVISRSRFRTPDVLKSGLKGDSVAYKLARGPHVTPQRRRLPAGSTLADIVGLLVGQVVPMRVGLDGRAAGWYRLGPASGPLPPTTRLEQLDPEQLLLFHVIEGRILTLDIEVHTEPSVVRLRAPVGTAIPAASLMDSLAALLDLPPADWQLVLDGVPLEPFDLLDDRPLQSDSRLVARRA